MSALGDGDVEAGVKGDVGVENVVRVVGVVGVVGVGAAKAGILSWEGGDTCTHMVVGAVRMAKATGSSESGGDTPA